MHDGFYVLRTKVICFIQTSSPNPHVGQYAREQLLPRAAVLRDEVSLDMAVLVDSGSTACLLLDGLPPPTIASFPPGSMFPDLPSGLARGGTRRFPKLPRLWRLQSFHRMLGFLPVSKVAGYPPRQPTYQGPSSVTISGDGVSHRLYLKPNLGQ